MTAETPQRPDCQVLVVEDHAGARKMIGAVLEAGGITNVVYAHDGVEALERLEETRPDLVILDIMMPRMDGFEVCRRLRGDPRFHRLPILVQTALGAPEERTEVFRAGATDVLPKPVHGPELIARVRVHLQNAALLRSLESYRQRVEEELDLARSMQADILPPSEDIAAICERHSLRVDPLFRTSSELGGDHWALEDLGDGRVAIALVDFAGHGVTAALNTFRLHTLMHHIAAEGSPAEHLAILNRHLTRLMRPGQFATFLYGVIDPARDTFTYASAGAPSPVLGGDGAARLLESSGLPVGITAEASYENRVAHFPPGAFLLLYSDALTESFDADGGLVEPDTLVAWSEEAAAGDDSERPLARLIRRFEANGRQVADDLTAIWIERGI